jgi:ribosomal protein S18 acetylase RimI-like enzyme
MIKFSFRAANVNDCPKIAQLFSIATGGVSNYVWSTLQADYPGLSLLEIGTKRFASEQTNFSYQNCVVVEHNNEVVGMMVTFEASETESEPNSGVANTSEISSSQPAVLAPYYRLKAPGTWYIGGLAVFPDFQGQGIGTQLLSIARQQAQQHGFQELSLLAFEQNTRAVKLYERNGFTVIDYVPVVPHKLIRYVGNILLMTAPI